MRTMILLAGSMLALTACGSNNEANQTDLAVNNLVVGDVTGANDAMSADMNGMAMNGMDMNGVAMNGAADANTANAMSADMNTNDPDTNLANGL